MVVSLPKMGRLRVFGQEVWKVRSIYAVIGHQHSDAESAVGLCAFRLLEGVGAGGKCVGAIIIEKVFSATRPMSSFGQSWRGEMMDP